jgi:hypothetical protein
MKKIVLVICFGLIICFGLYCMKEDSERHFALRERIHGSVVLSCISATGRGARGEVYKTTLYTLRDNNGTEWLYSPRYLQYEQLVCPITKGG